MPTIETIAYHLTRIETIVRQIARTQAAAGGQDWIPESEAIKYMTRSKRWLQQKRNGYGILSPALKEGTDWKMMNGKTPMYKKKSLGKLRNQLSDSNK